MTRPDKRSKHDKSLSGYRQLLKADPAEAERKADVIVKNTYRTLMTRGIRGCYVYFTDPATGAYFRSRLTSVREFQPLAKVAEPSARYVAQTRKPDS
jgi:hypothetical protein